jgi:hypothetical protein
MLFQLVKDEGAASGPGGDVAFHSRRDVALLVFSAALFGFGALCFFDAEPRRAGEMLALASFASAIVALFFGGLSTRLLFLQEDRRLDVSWSLFGFGVFSHSHPYSDIQITIRTVGGTGGSRWISVARGAGYYARVGTGGYFLVYPASVPVDDDRLGTVRKELGFPEKNETPRAGIPDEA